MEITSKNWNFIIVLVAIILPLACYYKLMFQPSYSKMLKLEQDAVWISRYSAFLKIDDIDRIINHIEVEENYKMDSYNWKYVGADIKRSYNGMQVEFVDEDIVSGKHIAILSNGEIHWIR